METQKIEITRLKTKMSVKELDKKYHDLYEASLIASDLMNAIERLNEDGKLTEYEYARLVSPVINVVKMLNTELGETHEASENAMKKSREATVSKVNNDKNTVTPTKIVEYLHTDYNALDNEHKAVKFYYEKSITPDNVSIKEASDKYNVDFKTVEEIIKTVEKSEQDEYDFYEQQSREESDVDSYERHVIDMETWGNNNRDHF